jgi:hypothetical protein
MKTIGWLAIALMTTPIASVFAQVNMQYSGQYTGQYSGRADVRVDGRANRNEGLPPSAADKGNRTFDNPIDPRDCAEVGYINPELRPGWQARVRSACNQ